MTNSKIAVSYRIPMRVSQIMAFKNGTFFALCPHCHITLEREYQNYCDRCGQALGWKNYSKATIIFPHTR